MDAICELCGRALKTAKAVERGFGEKCYKKVQQWEQEEYERQAPTAKEVERIIEESND